MASPIFPACGRVLRVAAVPDGPVVAHPLALPVVVALAAALR